MRDLVRAESGKTFSGHAWWVLLSVMGAVDLVIALFATDGGLATYEADILGYGGGFAALLGALCVTAEYGHRTIVTSYLIAADRPTLTVAKMVLAALVGAGYAVVCALLIVLGMVLRGNHPLAELASVLEVSGAAMVVFALWAVLGVAVGTLVRSSVVAILAVLMYQWIAEPLLVLLVDFLDNQSDPDAITQYLPTRSASAALSRLGGGTSSGNAFEIVQPWWVMLLVFTGWVALASAAGIIRAQRRDIT